MTYDEVMDKMNINFGLNLVQEQKLIMTQEMQMSVKTSSNVGI